MGSLIWLIAGIALIVLELTAGELTFLMLGLAAVATAGVSLFGIPIAGEVSAFAIFSFASLLFLKPFLKKRLHHEAVLDTSFKELEGKLAVVLEPVTADGGQVRLDGSIWSARSFDPNLSFTEGDRVIVVSIDGTTALVMKEV